MENGGRIASAGFRAVVCDRSLTETERRATILLGSMARADNRESWPGYTWIAKRLGVSVRSIERAVPEMVKRGYLIRLTVGGVNFETGQTRSARYAPNLDMTREFNIGLGAPTPTAS